MKKPLGYALAFTAGTLFSGTVALAGGTYVKALIQQSSVVVGSKTVSSASALQYNGKTYFQSDAITSALNSAGVHYTVNKSTLTLNPNTPTGSTAPTNTPANSALTQTQNKLTITVTGVKFTTGGVEISLKAVNHTGSNVMIDDILSETLTQGSSQLEADDMNTDVKRFPSTMANGVVSTAVLAFTGGSATSGDLKLTLPVISDNYDLTWKNFVFTIPPTMK